MSPLSLVLRLLAGIGLFIAAIPAASAGCDVPFWQETQVASILPSALATADLNGDQRPDVIATDSTKLYWLANNGNFAFAAPVTVYSGSLAAGVVAADFDGDGKADLVVADRTASAILFFRGAGNGSFAAAASSATALTPSRIIGGDFDGDGRPDLAVYDANSVLAIYRNGGSGTFSEAARAILTSAPVNVATGDLDGDGRADIALSHASSTMVDLFFGRADSTLTSTGSVDVRYGSTDLAIGSVASTAFGDLLAAAYYGPLTVMRNLDGRSFAYPLTYSTLSYPVSILLAELTGDGKLDVVVANNQLTEFSSYGDGTLHWGYTWYGKSYYSTSYGSAMASADFDGDGRRDLVVAEAFNYGPRSTWVLRNLCGDSSVTAVLAAPVVSVGQPATLNVTVGPPESTSSWPYVTGTVTLLDGSTTLDQKSVSNAGQAMFTVNGLSVGSHPLVASYGGDSQYGARDSSPAVLTVTTEVTTVDLVADPPQGQYGVPICFTPTVTSTLGKTVTGSVRLDIDGTAAGTPALGAQCETRVLEVGTHAISLVYLGNATTPRSAPRVFDYVVARNTVTVGSVTPASSPAGQKTSCTVTLRATPTSSWSYSVASLSGTLAVIEGPATLATSSLSSYSPFAIQLPPMTEGRHILKVVYSGDTHYTAAEKNFIFDVFPTAASTISARGTAEAIQLRFYSPGGWCSYRRMLPNGSTDAYACVTSPFDDTTARPNQLYLYRLESPDRMSHSNTDIAMRVAFTDDPLLPGMTIKAVHMSEIAAAVNNVRAAAGLRELALPDIAVGGVITSADIVALRSGLTEAFLALGATPPAFEEDIVAGQTVVRAAHLQELREAVR